MRPMAHKTSARVASRTVLILDLDAWRGVKNVDRHPGFVPEGLDEGSQAVYFMECVYKKDPFRLVRHSQDGDGGRARSELVY